MLDLTTCPLLTKADIGQLLRNDQLAKRAIYHFWIKPAVSTGEQGGGIKLYLRRDVDALIARVAAGEVPPEIPRKEAA